MALRLTRTAASTLDEEWIREQGRQLAKSANWLVALCRGDGSLDERHSFQNSSDELLSTVATILPAYWPSRVASGDPRSVLLIATLAGKDVLKLDTCLSRVLPRILSKDQPTAFFSDSRKRCTLAAVSSTDHRLAESWSAKLRELMDHATLRGPMGKADKDRPTESNDRTGQLVNRLNAEISRFQSTIAEPLAAWLATFEGRRFDTKEDAVSTIHEVTQIVRRAGRRLMYEGNPITIVAVCGKRQTKPSIQVRSRAEGKNIVVLNSVQWPALSTDEA